VIEFDSEKLAELEKIAEDLKASIDNDDEELKSMYLDIYRASSDSETRFRQKQYDVFESAVADKKEKYDEMVSGINDLETSSTLSNTEVILKDGQSFGVYSSDISSNADLALLDIGGEDCPYLIANTEENLALGKKVFTIGNPSGLQHTVTSGIISGYQEYQEKQMIQTDAPINPGNSGGPLIDSDGRVVGINTMILDKTEGIGFAIPISEVFEEFSSLSGSEY